jgi:hypothetical protein
VKIELERGEAFSGELRKEEMRDCLSQCISMTAFDAEIT